MDGEALFGNRPAMKLCLPLVAGILVGWYWDIPMFGSVSGFGVCLALILVGRITGKLLQYEPLLITGLILSLGTIKITHDAKLTDDRDAGRFVSSTTVVRLKGTIADVPRWSTHSLRFVLHCDSLETGEYVRHITGDILVSVRAADVDSFVIDSLQYGRELELFGKLIAPGTARNPGEFDLHYYLRLNGISARFFADGLALENVVPDVSSGIMGTLVFPVRQSIGERLDKLIGGDESKFLKGLMIGERSEIPIEVKTAFINAGVMHILAVSGLHVGLILLIIWVVLESLRIPERPRIFLTSVMLIYYVFLTGAAPSVTRAVIMAIVYLSAKLIERKPDVYNNLALSAIVILLVDSKQLFKPGFQLSFVAVLSLVYLGPKIYDLRSRLPQRLQDQTLVRLLWMALSVSIAAGVGTLPFTSMYFGKISLISFIANLFVVPLANIVLPLGMITIALSYLSWWLAGIYAGLASMATWLLLHVVEFFGGLPFAYLDSYFSVWSSVGFYAIVGSIIHIRRREYWKYYLVTIVVALNVWVYWLLLMGPKPLTVTFLDVGQGDAVYVEFPGGENLLMDAGPRTLTYDAGSRIIEPYLRRQGIKHLHTLALSHPHSDHLGGVPYLLRRIRVGQVVDAGTHASSALFSEYRHVVDSLKIPFFQLTAGMTLLEFKHARAYITHPSGPTVFGGGDGNLNNHSLVLKIVYRESSILLAGDAEHEAEEVMSQRYGDFLRSDVLKVGHHGSLTSSTPEFLHDVRPEYAVVSVGERNKFRHPSPTVIGRLSDLGIRTMRTDENGAIVLRSDGARWTLVDWR